MLFLGQKLKDTPVMSLQTGAEIARTTEAIIDPAVLEVVAYRLGGPRLPGQDTLLLTNDIREVSNIGFIVDGSDELLHVDEVLKVKKIIGFHFELVGLEVVDDMKHKLGKIQDYSIDPLSFTIHQLYVKPPLLKSLQNSDLIIHRRQIIEINNKRIVVSSTSLEERPLPAAAAGNFMNPFRAPSEPSPNTSDV